MGAEGGLAGYRQFKQIPSLRGVPIILVGALSDAKDRAEGFQAGAVDYLSKPLEKEEVLARVQTQLRLHQSLKALEQQNRLLEERIEEQVTLALVEWSVEIERLESVLALGRMGNQSSEELVSAALDHSLRLTHSGGGFFAAPSKDGTTMTIVHSCGIAFDSGAASAATVVPVESLWGTAVRRAKPVILNYCLAGNSDQPQQQGYQNATVPTRLMSTLSLEQGAVVAVAGVVDKAQGYDERDLRQLQFVMDGLWQILCRRRAEDALRASEERMALVLEGSNDGWWDWDLRKKRIYCSPQF